MSAPSTGSRPVRTTSASATVLAARPLLRHRTVDLVVAAMLGVAFGVVFWGWDLVYAAPADALGTAFAPLAGLLGGPWLLAGVVGGLVVRRPGAALLTELVGASVEALLGNQWGWTTLISGSLQGLGVEVALGLFLWRRFGWVVALVAGASSAVFEVALYEWQALYADWSWTWKLAYLGCFALSGAVVAGLGGRAIVQALARSGAVRAMPPGHEALERSAE